MKIAHASINENGTINGGTPGDQTGGEVCIRDYYDKNWTCALRPKDYTVGYKIVRFMIDAANNDNIGYCQDHRITLYNALQKVEFHVRMVSEKVECDCSSLVACALIAAGVPVSPDIYTGNMVNAIAQTDMFDLIMQVTPDKLLPGDILVKEGSHTAVVVGFGGAKPIPGRWYFTVDGWYYQCTEENVPGVSNTLDSILIPINGHIYLFDRDCYMKKGKQLVNGEWMEFEDDPDSPLEGALKLPSSFVNLR